VNNSPPPWNLTWGKAAALFRGWSTNPTCRRADAAASAAAAKSLATATVGTAIFAAPHRSRRAELPHGAPASGQHVEPPVGTRVPEFRVVQLVSRDPHHPLACQPVPLTAPPQSAASSARRANCCRAGAGSPVRYLSREATRWKPRAGGKPGEGWR
jgi:hypothetical protein